MFVSCKTFARLLLDEKINFFIYVLNLKVITNLVNKWNTNLNMPSICTNKLRLGFWTVYKIAQLVWTCQLTNAKSQPGVFIFGYSKQNFGKRKDRRHPKHSAKQIKCKTDCFCLICEIHWSDNVEEHSPSQLLNYYDQ